MRPIGVIHTPFSEKQGTPIQGYLAPETEGTVEVFTEYADGLKDIEEFSHIVLLYCFHESRGYDLVTRPFPMRAPRRPNPIGFTAVKLLKRDGNILHISGVDMLDGTPLLDIKPYVAEFDHFKDVKRGWLDKHADNPGRTQADDRFGK
jgi:tRNA-Thr(GGU) m(6)t(6)A37 methyltransferase TsaA